MLLPLLRVKAAERAMAVTRTPTGRSCTQMMTMMMMTRMQVLKVSTLPGKLQAALRRSRFVSTPDPCWCEAERGMAVESAFREFNILSLLRNECPSSPRQSQSETCAWVRVDQSLHRGEQRWEEQAQEDMRVGQGGDLRVSQAIHLACPHHQFLVGVADVVDDRGGPSVSSFTV